MDWCSILKSAVTVCVYEVTLLYEIASNSSLIWAGFWMSSSFEDRGWEEARASTANTLWTSLSTMRSFYNETKQDCKVQTPPINDTITLCYSKYWGHEVGGEFIPLSSRVQPRWLPGTQHRMQSLHSATSHSTTSGSPDYQTTKGTAERKGETAMPRKYWK